MGERDVVLSAWPHAGATFSPCRRYRYALWRAWDDRIRALWIMLNPSTADEADDDPTIRRCISYTRAWGWGGLFVVNLFSLRSTNPAVLRNHSDPVGPLNDWVIDQIAATTAGPVVCAWGAPHRSHEDRAAEVGARLCVMGHKLRCLGTSKEGWPRHPLYLRRDQPLKHWP